MRTLLILIAAPLLTTFAPLSLVTTPPLPPLASLTFKPLPLDGKDPARRTVGRLEYFGGWSIRSDDRRFGGISAMHVEGDEVIALSDAGSVIRFALPGRGPATADIFALPEGPGSSPDKENRDVEAMTAHKGRYWLAFEGANEVWRYSSRWKSRSSAAPPGMRDWPMNSGTEAMLRLADGRFVLFREEKARADGTTGALLFVGDPAAPGTKARAIRYRPPSGYRITDAATLPDGRLLFLNRRFSFSKVFTAKLTLGPNPAGAIELLSGEEIAHFELPLAVDNMEALSVTREGGRDILWIASDDNLNPIQRTILLKLALRD
jgi:hypothetical protein